MSTKAIIVTPPNHRDLKFLRALLDKLGYPSRELSSEDIEDAALLDAMLKERRNDLVPESEIREA